jgi:MFS family permease
METPSGLALDGLRRDPRAFASRRRCSTLRSIARRLGRDAMHGSATATSERGTRTSGRPGCGARLLAMLIVLAGFLPGMAWLVLFFAVPLAIIFVVAIFAGAVMTLAWGLLFKLMPTDDRGAIAGLATTTKGIGLIVGTLLAGILIDRGAMHAAR